MLQTELAKIEGVTLLQRDAVDIIHIETALAKAQISLQGATLLSYQSIAQQELLWVSEQAVFDGKKAIRGGIPVCWPWFGKAEQDGLPAHGFVRNQPWSVASVETLESGAIKLVLQIKDSAESLAIWPFKFKLSLAIEIGETLKLGLTSHNLNDEAMFITEALHTYFNVANPQSLQIDGLQLSTHIDTLYADRGPEVQINKVALTPPRDSVYLKQSGPVTLEDEANFRHIVIKKQNSRSTIVWNPGPEIIKGFTDMDNNAWQQFACVESGNVWDEQIKIAPHETHTMSVEYIIESV